MYIDDKPSLDELMHFGVKGMKWGIRRDGPEGVPPKTNREARKDAEEFTKAKMFYGESAGTRRKLIKASVTAKSNRNPAYKKAFDYHVEKTDMAKRAEQAKGARTRKNAVNSTRKTARGVGHILKGNSQYANIAATVLVAGGAYAHQQGIDKVVMNNSKKRARDISNSPQARRAAQAGAAFIKRAGF